MRSDRATAESRKAVTFFYAAGRQGDASQADCSASQYEACVDGACVVQPYCGDGKVNGGEVCDPTADEWNPWTCNEQCERTTAYAACNQYDDDDSDCDGECILGICEPALDLCNTDADCPPGPSGVPGEAICSGPGGRCGWVCSARDGCPPGLVCQKVAETIGQCRRCGPRSLGEVSCYSGQTCVPLSPDVTTRLERNQRVDFFLGTCE